MAEKGIDQLLERYNARCKSPDTPSNELALRCLLDRNRERLCAADDYFHKSFRQLDIIPCPGVDMAIWHLLQNAPIFWSCFAEVTAMDTDVAEVLE